MSKKDQEPIKPRFDIYPLLSRWDFWLAVVFILVVMVMLVIYMLPAPLAV